MFYVRKVMACCLCGSILDLWNLRCLTCGLCLYRRKRQICLECFYANVNGCQFVLELRSFCGEILLDLLMLLCLRMLHPENILLIRLFELGHLGLYPVQFLAFLLSFLANCTLRFLKLFELTFESLALGLEPL